MSMWRPVQCAVIIGFGLLAPPSKVIAQAGANADTREISAYRLTDAGLAKFTAATNKLVPVLDEHPLDCDDGEDNPSIDAMTARLAAVPGAAAAVQSAGLGTREYVVFNLAMFHNGLAAWALDQGGELPPGASMDNVQFFKKHEGKMQQLAGPLKSVGCESEDDYDDDEEADWEDEDWEEDEGWGEDGW